MPCRITCLIAAIFLIGMIFMMNGTTNSGIIKNYEKQLPPELRTVYNSIVKERTSIYFMGYVLGFVLALIIIFYNVQIKKGYMSISSMVCLVVSVSFLTNYFYYILSPKSKWMLEHIKTPEQNHAWLKMYKGMQFYYHGGLALGVIAVGLFAFAFRC